MAIIKIGDIEIYYSSTGSGDRLLLFPDNHYRHWLIKMMLIIFPVALKLSLLITLARENLPMQSTIPMNGKLIIGAFGLIWLATC